MQISEFMSTKIALTILLIHITGDTNKYATSIVGQKFLLKQAAYYNARVNTKPVNKVETATCPLVLKSPQMKTIRPFKSLITTNERCLTACL